MPLNRVGSFKLAVLAAVLLSLLAFSGSATETTAVSTACLLVRTVGIDINDNNTVKRTAVIEFGRNVQIDFSDNRRYNAKVVDYRIEKRVEDPAAIVPEWTLVLAGKKSVLQDQDSEIAFVIDPQTGLLPAGTYRIRLSIGHSVNGVRETGSCRLMPAVLISEVVRTPPFVVAGQPAGTISRTFEQWQDAVLPIEFKILPQEAGEGGQ